MKKFAISIATLAIAVSACGDMNGDNNNEQVEDQPEVNMAENNEDNNNDNNLTNDFNDDEDNDENNDVSTGMDSDEETEAVMDQDIENFELNVTLVDDSQWDFNYSPSEDEGEQADASISGDDIELEGEQAAEEMETYLSNFHVNAASDQEEIKSEIADTFDFNEADIKEFNLTIHFSEQDSETEWSWSDEQNNED